MLAWSNFNHSPTRKKIREKWLELLNDNTKKEQDYQSFLRNHAGMFIPSRSSSFKEQIVLEKIKLGAEYITDFVSIDGDRSYGFQYTLIEIESPHDNLFTSKGTKSAHLVQSLDQISNWQRWMDNSKSSSLELFPSWIRNVSNHYRFHYLLVIGRRNDSTSEKEKLKQIANQHKIEIRSFDYLTDIFSSRLYNSFTSISTTGAMIPSTKQNNEFTNPFYAAYSDRKWRKITKELKPPHYHIVGRNISTILKYRTYNENRLAEYKKWAMQDGNNDFSPLDEDLGNLI